MSNSTDYAVARVTLRIVRDPLPRAVPDVVYPDGRRSSSWAEFHRARRVQRPELYEGLGDPVDEP